MQGRERAETLLVALGTNGNTRGSPVWHQIDKRKTSRSMIVNAVSMLQDGNDQRQRN